MGRGAGEMRVMKDYQRRFIFPNRSHQTIDNCQAPRLPSSSSQRHAHCGMQARRASGTAPQPLWAMAVVRPKQGRRRSVWCFACFFFPAATPTTTTRGLGCTHHCRQTQNTQQPAAAVVEQQEDAAATTSTAHAHFTSTGASGAPSSTLTALTASLCSQWKRSPASSAIRPSAAARSSLHSPFSDLLRGRRRDEGRVIGRMAHHSARTPTRRHKITFGNKQKPGAVAGGRSQRR